METAPSKEAVYQSIYALHVNPDPAEKSKASTWLDSLQKSVHSWTIANELLQEKRDVHSCYFAAQTMRSKIRTSFHELPVEVHNSLRDTLMAHILQIDNQTATVVVTQLCMAVADLALLMSSWENPILELIEKLSANRNSLWPLIDIITQIPEEINSKYLRLGANRREEINRQLKHNSRTVFDLLVACLTNSNDDPELMLKVIRCFNSWIAIHVLITSDITNNIIVGQCFNVLSSVGTSIPLHDAAADCVCTLLNCLEKINDKHMMELQLFNNVCQLENANHLAVAHEDMCKLTNFCRIFTVLAESFLDKMIVGSEESPHYSIKSLDLVLNCVGHYDYEVAEMTFTLWYRLSEEIYQKNKPELQLHFKSHIERLLSCLYRHSQMDNDQDGLIDDNDTFADFRNKVSNVIKDVIFIIGSSNCFKQMYQILLEPNVSWESSEAALFVMGNVAKNISPEENDIVPKVAEAILHLPENTHVAVRYTSIILLGELRDWIDCHPETLQSILNFLLYSLQQKNGLATAAASALTSICTKCSKHMTCHITGLVEIARNLDNFEITNESAINLLKGISFVVSDLPIDQLTIRLEEICSFQLSPLCTLLELTDIDVDKNSRSDPCFWIDRLAAVIRHTVSPTHDTDVHPCLIVITKAWPILSNVLNKYQSDVRIMERTSRCIRYAMRCIGRPASVLLEPLVKQMITLYAVHQHSCFLYLGSVLVDEYSSINDQCVQGLLDMLQAFMEPTFKILQAHNGLQNHPDTVEDFFRLCSRFIQHCAIPFLQSPIVSPILQCALLACTLDHRDANLSVMKFFYSLLNGGRPEKESLRQSLVRQIIDQHGAELVRNLIFASVYRLHTYMLSDVADVIVELKAIDSEKLSQSLTYALDSLPTKNSGGCTTATQSQLDHFHNSILRSEGTKAVTQALKEFLRLYR